MPSENLNVVWRMNYQSLSIVAVTAVALSVSTSAHKTYSIADRIPQNTRNKALAKHPRYNRHNKKTLTIRHITPTIGCSESYPIAI